MRWLWTDKRSESISSIIKEIFIRISIAKASYLDSNSKDQLFLLFTTNY